MNNPLYDEFAARFAASSLTSLVETFNTQVGNRGWTSARAAHNVALIKELIRRGVDVSDVFDGESLSFARYVILDGNRLTVVASAHSTERVPGDPTMPPALFLI